MSRHVVDDDVHDHVDPDAIALLDHVDEGVPVTSSTLQLVADGLVSCPPLTSLDVLIWGAHLYLVTNHDI